MRGILQWPEDSSKKRPVMCSLATLEVVNIHDDVYDIEMLFALLSLCAGNPTVIMVFPIAKGQSHGALVSSFCKPKEAIELSELPVIWDIWPHCNILCPLQMPADDLAPIGARPCTGTCPVYAGCGLWNNSCPFLDKCWTYCTIVYRLQIQFDTLAWLSIKVY